VKGKGDGERAEDEAFDTEDEEAGDKADEEDGWMVVGAVCFDVWTEVEEWKGVQDEDAVDDDNHTKPEVADGHIDDAEWEVDDEWCEERKEGDGGNQERPSPPELDSHQIEANGGKEE